MKKVLKIKAKDFMRMLGDNTGGEDVTKEHKVTLTDKELDTMISLLDMFEGDDNDEQDLLDDLVTKLNNCKNK